LHASINCDSILYIIFMWAFSLKILLCDPMSYKTITYEERDKVGILCLNRPRKRNALSRGLLEEFTSCIKDAGRRGSVRVIIIRGEGEHFCAGHDLVEILEEDQVGIRGLFEACIRLMNLLQQIPQPVIAQVRGVATAAGCQLVAASDLAVAEEGALFATPGVKIGLFCSTPMVPLSRAVGRKRALEMLFTGRFVSAREALDFGLINRLVPLEKLEEETWKLARDIARYSLATLGLGKHGFYRQWDMAEGQAYEFAKELIAANALMEDAKEGISAFLEKRKPRWKDGE